MSERRIGFVHVLSGFDGVPLVHLEHLRSFLVLPLSSLFTSSGS